MANNYPIPPKRFAFAATTEATPGTPETINWATDAIRLLDVAVPEPDYLAPNTREGAITGTLGRASAAPPAGKFYRVPIRFPLVGAGAAYSASVFPECHYLLLAAGFSGTVDTTGGAEKWTYTLSDDPVTALTVAVDIAGKQYVSTFSVLEGLTISKVAGSFPVAEGTLVGVASSEAETDLDSATYRTFAAAQYPIMKGANSLVIGAYSPQFQSCTLALNTEAQPNLSGNATDGHAGYRLVSRAPLFDVSARVVAVATWDPRADVTARTTRAINTVAGSTQYTRVKLDMDDARALSAVPTADGNYMNYAVTYEVNPATSEVSIVFD